MTRATEPSQVTWHATAGNCAKTVGVTASLLPSFAARDKMAEIFSVIWPVNADPGEVTRADDGHAR